MRVFRLSQGAAVVILAALLVGAGALGAPAPRLEGVPPAQAAPAAVSAGSRVPWQGGSWYLHGANVPWYHWGCDFGCAASGGASSTAVQGALAPGFAQARASGMHTIRWWVFPGAPWQITRDGAGAPTGLTPAIYADFDAALRLADEHDLYYVFVLFSSPTSIPSTWLTDAGRRTQLAGALGPLFARYRGHPRVLAWEVFNEPEYDIWNGKIAQAPVQATVKAIASAVHANSTAYVTVGSAMLDGLPMWLGQGLDFYQAHWYDYMAGGGWCARCTDYASVKARFGLDAPLVIGELYTGPDTDALQRFEDFYAKGYAGAWPWSLFPDRTNDKMAIDHAAAAAFAGRPAAQLGPRATGTVTPTPTPAPTATRTSTPPSAVPTAPTGLAAAASSRQVVLSWTDAAANEAGFAIERGRDGSSFAEIGRTGANATAYTDTGLAANTTYWYRVRAFNAAGYSGYSNTVRVKTPRK
jgi:hypothetical protein